MLDVGDLRDVHQESGGLGLAVSVEPFEGVHVVEVGDLRQRGGGFPLTGLVVGERRREAGVADEATGCLVVAKVVDRRRSQDDVGIGPAEGLDDPPPRLIVIEDRKVAKLQASVIGAYEVGRRLGFEPPDGGDGLGVAVDAPAVAGRHRGDGDSATGLGQ